MLSYSIIPYYAISDHTMSGPGGRAKHAGLPEACRWGGPLSRTAPGTPSEGPRSLWGGFGDDVDPLPFGCLSLV